MSRFFTLCLLVAIIAGCGDMDFKVNEKVVYSPRPAFSEFDIPDPALRACVEQAIADNRVTAAAQLRHLNCPDAGIEKLDGLATFTGLTRLDLSRNRIGDLAELGALSTLQVIELAGNAIVDPVPLFELPALQQVDLRGNPALQCPARSAFTTVENLRLPAHCATP